MYQNMYKTILTSSIITRQRGTVVNVVNRFCSKTEIPKNVLVEKSTISAHLQSENGVVYDKKPLKIALEKDKKYAWCLCGHSRTQPFCDGTHRNQQLKITQKPIVFKVEESKDYWLCNCKHTKNRPFCDGTHMGTKVQEAPSKIRQ